MPPRSKTAAPSAPLPAADSLAQEVAKLAGQVEALNERLDTLHQVIQVLTSAIDDIRQEFEFAVRNDQIGRGRDQWRPTMDLVNLPKESPAPQFQEADKIRSAQNHPQESGIPSLDHPPAAGQRGLFD